MAQTPIATRWARADSNFRKQIRMLMAEMGTASKERVASEAGIASCTFYRIYNSPSRMTKCAERQIASVFERSGMRYDMTLGEGAGV